MHHIFRATFVATLFISVGLCAQMPTPPTALTPTNTQNHQTTIQPLIATPITVNATGVVSAAEVTSVNTALGTNIANCQRTVTYIDGLGQVDEYISIGTVSNVAPITPAVADNTLVKIVTKDGHYRPKNDFLPFASGTTATNDDFVATAVTAVTTSANNFYPNANNTIANDNAIPNGSINYEASPLDRVKNVFKPGNATQSVSYGYALNNTTVDGTIKNWKFDETAQSISAPTTYSGNELYKNTSIDEDGHTVHQFYNRRGQLILHRVFLSTPAAITNCADTYYMYNNWGNVNCIATPAAVGATGLTSGAVNDLFYFYQYDNRQRLKAKKIPGKSIERYVYNKFDKVALRQDGVLAALNQWEFTKYDHLARVIMTGIFSSTDSQATLQTNFDGVTQSFENRTTTATTSISDTGYSNSSLPSISSITSINTLYYYDSYTNIRSCLSANATAIAPSSDIQMASGITPITFKTIPATAPALGMSNTAVTVSTTTDLDNYAFTGHLVAVRRRVLKPTGSTSWSEMGEWNNTLYFYDRYGRPTIETNLLPTGGKRVTHRTYRFDGQVDTEVTKQQLLSATAATSDLNRVYWVKKTYAYDNDGRLVSYSLAPTFTTTVGATPTFPVAQEAAVYQYNELGQLTMKRLHTVTSGTSYWQNIDYRYNIKGELIAINNADDACPPAAFAPDNSDDTAAEKADNTTQVSDATTTASDATLPASTTNNSDNIPYDCATPITPDSSYNCLINYPFTGDSLLAIAEGLPNYMEYDPTALQPIVKRFEGTTITTVQLLQILQGAINEPRTERWRWRKRDMAHQSGLDTMNLSRYRLLYLHLQDAVLAHAGQQCQQTPPTALLAASNTTAPDPAHKQSGSDTPTVTPEVPQPPQPPLPPSPPPTSTTVDPNDLFAMNLFYNGYNTASDLGNVTNTAAFNGNIAATKWRMGTTLSCQKHVYAYSYDGADRLTNALYAQQTGSGTNTNLNRFDETMTYNRNGDILSLVRKGSIGSTTFGTMDNLTYTYNTTGVLSQLQKVAEAGNNTFGFTDLNPTATTDYTYDTNGNMLTDQNKNISIAYYPTLNQPQKVTKAADRIEWLYDAAGNKIAMGTFVGATTTKQVYLGGFEYSNQVFRSLYHAEGRITNTSATPTTSTTLRHEYYLRDHLGNPRILFTDANNNGSIAANDILQTSTYYPYGSVISSLSSGAPTVPNDYKYNGKEFVDDLGLNMLDYGARLYDPLTGRWNGVDALAERYASSGTYNYVLGNPILMVDPDGMRNMVYVVFLQSSGLNTAQKSAVIAEMQRIYDDVIGLRGECGESVIKVTEFDQTKRGRIYGEYLDASDAVVTIGSVNAVNTVRQRCQTTCYGAEEDSRIFIEYGNLCPELSENVRTKGESGRFVGIGSQRASLYAKRVRDNLINTIAFLGVHGTGHNVNINHPYDSWYPLVDTYSLMNEDPSCHIQNETDRGCGGYPTYSRLSDFLQYENNCNLLGYFLEKFNGTTPKDNYNYNIKYNIINSIKY